ncbi:MAG TPA: DUF3089 domain-containing protein [Longimicrobiales bacterium]|nr:DUF3089 domain-containing protein [Longimicrobiales bacterium]
MTAAPRHPVPSVLRASAAPPTAPRLGTALAAVALALALGLTSATGVSAQSSAARAAAVSARAGHASPVDYGDPASWLCLPGRDDACAQDMAATVIAADGSMSVETFAPDRDAPIDCFYVYPTVSTETTPNSSITAGPGETNVAWRQLARFAEVCKPYAPLYRQVTLAALRAGLAGGAGLGQGDREMAYQDVLAAWRYYLAEQNGGRGVVLIGHSQGSSVLSRLIQEEIDGKPVQDRIVSAILLGWNVNVPEGRDVGGDFQHMPLCRARTQTGCVVTYVSFRATSPPPAQSLFGRTTRPGMVIACTNPGALAGGEAELRAYLTNDRTGLEPWVASGKAVETPFVRVPGMIRARCVRDEHGSYLSIRVDASEGPRTDVIGGDVMGADGRPNPIWGLHLYDMALGIGDLIDLVRVQAGVYAAAS